MHYFCDLPFIHMNAKTKAWYVWSWIQGDMVPMMLWTMYIPSSVTSMHLVQLHLWICNLVVFAMRPRLWEVSWNFCKRTMNVKPSACQSSAIARRCTVKQAWNMDTPDSIIFKLKALALPKSASLLASIILPDIPKSFISNLDLCPTVVVIGEVASCFTIDRWGLDGRQQSLKNTSQHHIFDTSS
jgi:hypothetical protein